MPRSLQNIVRLRPPFGGLDLASPLRAVDARDAVVANNIVTNNNGISVREPVKEWVADLSAAGFIEVTRVELMRWFTPRYESTGQAIPHLMVIAMGAITGPQASGRVLVFDDDGALVLNHELVALSYIGGISVVPVNDILYVFSQLAAITPRKLYYTTAWKNQTVGITPPSGSSVVLQAGGTLDVDTEYSYRIAYYNSNVDVESGPDDADSVTTNAANKTCRVAWNGSGDSDDQIRHVRIYRMQVGLDDTWYFIKQETYTPHIAGAWNDTGAITPTKEFDTRVNLAVGKPPRCFAAAWHKSRMWYAPSLVADGRGTVVVSELFRPENVNPLLSWSVGNDDGDQVRAMVSWAGVLWVLKDYSIWTISGDSPESFSAQQVGWNAGCRAQHSVVATESAIYFAGVYGIYRLDSGGVKLISEEIAELWAQYQPDIYGSNTTAAYDRHSGLLIFSVNPSATPSEIQFVLNLHNNKWTTWSLPAIATGLFQSSSDTYPRPYFCIDTTGKLVRCKFDSTWVDYGDAAIAYEWQSGDLDLGIAWSKRFAFLTLLWDRDTASGDNVTLRTDLDGQLCTSDSVPHNRAAAKLVQRVAGVGNLLSFKISGNATSKTEFTGVEIDAEPMGYR